MVFLADLAQHPYMVQNFLAQNYAPQYQSAQVQGVPAGANGWHYRVSLPEAQGGASFMLSFPQPYPTMPTTDGRMRLNTETMKVLEAAGLPVAKLQATQVGGLFSEFPATLVIQGDTIQVPEAAKGRKATLETWMPGNAGVINNTTLDQAIGAGTLLAKVHVALAGANLPLSEADNILAPLRVRESLLRDMGFTDQDYERLRVPAMLLRSTPLLSEEELWQPASATPDAHAESLTMQWIQIAADLIGLEPLLELVVDPGEALFRIDPRYHEVVTHASAGLKEMAARHLLRLDDGINAKPSAEIVARFAAQIEAGLFKEILHFLAMTEEKAEALTSARQVPLHSDPNPNNFLFTDPGTVSALVDWNTVGLGNPAYEIVMASATWSFNTNFEYQPTTTEALIKAYHQGNPLSADEQALLKDKSTLMVGVLRYLRNDVNAIVTAGAMSTEAFATNVRDPMEYMMKLRALEKAN
jgi:Ser/Thr protein kinase RdoA (MazF antagonist)